MVVKSIAIVFALAFGFVGTAVASDRYGYGGGYGGYGGGYGHYNRHHGHGGRDLAIGLGAGFLLGNIFSQPSYGYDGPYSYGPPVYYAPPVYVPVPQYAPMYNYNPYRYGWRPRMYSPYSRW